MAQQMYYLISQANYINIILHTVICDHYGILAYKHLGLVTHHAAALDIYHVAPHSGTI